MVVVAQLVRASDCGSEGRGFDPHLPPKNKAKAGNLRLSAFFVFHWRGGEYSQYYILNSFAFHYNKKGLITETFERETGLEPAT